MRREGRWLSVELLPTLIKGRRPLQRESTAPAPQKQQPSGKGPVSGPVPDIPPVYFVRDLGEIRPQHGQRISQRAGKGGSRQMVRHHRSG